MKNNQFTLMNDVIITFVINKRLWTFKAIFSKDEAPHSIFPSIIGGSKYKNQNIGRSNKDIVVRNEVCVKAEC
jgi:hypothetical protein